METKLAPLNKLCRKHNSSLRLKDVVNGEEGPYPVYGASGIVGHSSSYQFDREYVAVVKDGAGVGRVLKCEANSSVLGTLQPIVPIESVNRDYLFSVLETLDLAKYTSGSTIPHIYFKDYGRELVPCLDHAEQNLLASRFETVNLTLDACNTCIEKCDSLVKSRFTEMFGDAVTIQGKWRPCALIDCVESLESGNSPSCGATPREGLGPGVLKLSALSSGMFLSGENKAMLEGETIARDKEVRRGDILLARKNTLELVGSCVLVREEVSNLMFPDIVFRMHPNDRTNGEYLVTLLSGPAYSSRVKALAHGSNKSMSNIPKSELAKLPIPIPPLALQQEFADFANQVDKLRFDVQRQIEQLETLKKSLMQEYFG